MPSATSLALRSSSFLPGRRHRRRQRPGRAGEQDAVDGQLAHLPAPIAQEGGQQRHLQLIDDPARGLKLAGDPRQLHPTIEVRHAHHADDRADGLHVIGRDQHLRALRHIRGPALGDDLRSGWRPGWPPSQGRRHGSDPGCPPPSAIWPAESSTSAVTTASGRILDRAGAGPWPSWPRPSTSRRPPVRDESWRVDSRDDVRACVLVAIGLSSLVLWAPRCL